MKKTKTKKGLEVTLTPKIGYLDHPVVYAEFDHPELGSISFELDGYGTTKGQDGAWGTARKVGRVVLTIHRSVYDEVLGEAKAMIESEKDKIRSGETLIEVKWYNGDPLSGYMTVTRWADDLLKKVGAAEDISGWGTIIDQDMVKSLGESFTLAAAKKFMATKKPESAPKASTPEKPATVDSMTIREERDEDEGGKTVTAITTVTMKTGNQYVFSDRNVFDVGRVINPAYAISEGRKPGGLHNIVDGVRVWQDFDSDHGWQVVRPLTDEEKDAYDWVGAAGYFAHSNIRM